MLHFQVRKISNVLQAQHFLDRLCKALKDAAAKEDLAEGKNGASKLTKEQIDAVFEFSRAVGDKATSDFDKSGELWNCLVESRKQKVGKSSSTFKEAMEALELTIACGYLDNLKVEEEKEERSSPESKEGGKAKKDRSGIILARIICDASHDAVKHRNPYVTSVEGIMALFKHTQGAD